MGGAREGEAVVGVCACEKRTGRCQPSQPRARLLVVVAEERSRVVNVECSGIATRLQSGRCGRVERYSKRKEGRRGRWEQIGNMAQEDGTRETYG